MSADTVFWSTEMSEMNRLAHGHAAHGHHNHGGGAFKTSAHATLHCLTGCVIGEVAGLMIGITLSLEHGRR